MNRDLHHLREDYQFGALSESRIPKNPMPLFSAWFDQANSQNVPEPNAMTLGTVDSDGQPSARIVLLKRFDEEGFVFYTNYRSRKGKEISKNSKVALCFFWLPLERQVRIEGTAMKLSEEESTAYFQSRPKGSQIGAWVSPQSDVINDRNDLEESYKRIEKENELKKVLEKPPHWGGYIVIPSMIEFWQGRSSRLHDRIRYRISDGEWKVDRLAP